MAKRFIDTGFLNQKWIRKLSSEHKCFLIYLMLKCDNAGIIDLDLEDAEFWIGKKINDTLNFLQDNYLISIPDEGKYFIPKFIEWQYGDLSSNKNIVVQARQILNKYGLINEDYSLNLPEFNINVSKKLSKTQITSNSNGKDNSNTKEEVNFKKRLDKFKTQVSEFKQYPEQIRNEFIQYWTEPNKSKTRMRFELEKTWDLNRRIIRWNTNNSNFNKSKSPSKKESVNFQTIIDTDYTDPKYKPKPGMDD